MTATNKSTCQASRHSRLQDAHDYKVLHGWTPLTPEQHEEFMEMVAEFTNL